MKEIWQDIKNCEEYYQVSNMGRILSKDRMSNNNGYEYVRKGRILKGVPNSRGYLRVQLKIKNETKVVFIHRMVAIMFIPNPNNKLEVNHMDSNHQNNALSNLEWTTHMENMHHAIDKGRFKESFSNTLDKFKADRESKQKAVIGTNIKTGEKVKYNTINEAGRHFKNAAAHICNCCKGTAQTSCGYTWEYALKHKNIKT